jgi:ribosomal protein S7
VLEKPIELLNRALDKASEEMDRASLERGGNEYVVEEGRGK